MFQEIYDRMLVSGALIILIKSLFVVVFIFLVYIFVNVYFKKKIYSLEKRKSTEERRLKQTRVNFTRILINYLLWIAAVIYILFLIPGFEAFSISLLAGAGIAAIVIGFAAQKTLANIVSGISIAIYTPFRMGDRLKIGEEFGDVESINLRHTIIRTWDNRRVVIPNSIMGEKEIINYSIKDEKLLITLDIGISYDADIDKAKGIMLKLARKHKDIITPELKDEYEGIVKKEPNVRVTNCGEYSVNLRLYFWVESPRKAWTTKFDLLETIKKEFDKQGIEIPFPYRTIVYKKDLEEQTKKKKER